MKDSVLFDEYIFEHEVNPEALTSFNVYPADSIEGPVFVIDSESADSQQILVTHDQDIWTDKFHNVNI